MKVILQKQIPDESSTKKFAKQIFEDFLKSVDNFTIFFEGGLGAGKTFLIREFLYLFGFIGEVSSPTYVFVNEYKANKKKFAHFDMYRLSNPQEFFARGFTEIAEDQNISKFVEWPDKISSIARDSFSGKKYCIRIDYGVGVGMRKIKFLEC